MAQAFGGELGVQRHVGATGLEHRQQRHQQVRAALQTDRHPHLRADAGRLQAMGQLVGAAVQLGIGQVQAFLAQGDSLRRARHLGFEALHQIEAGLVGAPCGAGRQQRGALIGGQQGQLAQPARRILGEGQQQLMQMAVQALDGCDVETGAVEAVAEGQVIALVDQQHQRVVALLAADQVGEARAIALATEHAGIEGVVLEYQDLVEQPLAALPAPALDVVQRGVFVLAHGQAQGLHLIQPLAHGPVGLRAGGNGQGVDEQAELLLDARQFCRTAGHCGTEGHAVLAGVALQQEQPGSLEQTAEGDLVLAGELAQALAGGSRQQRTVFGGATARLFQGDGASQQRWRLQPGQVLAPEALAGRRVAFAQPGDVIAVATNRGARLLAGITLHDFGKELRLAPAVQQQVVAGPDQVVAAAAGAHHQQAHQRRVQQVEGAALITRQSVQIARRNHAQVQRNIAQHRLQRPAAGGIDEGAAQRSVAVEGGLPGGAESRQVQAFDIHLHLVDVAAIARLIEAVEQHALLHRRQWVKVFYAGDGQLQAIQLHLVDARQGEVRRRGAASFRVQAVRHQRFQLDAVELHQFRQALFVDLLRAEGPAQAQAAVVHATVDGQPVVQRRTRIDAVAAGLGGAAQRAAVEAGIELAKVVEGHARLGTAAQLRAHIRRGQALQQAEAKAVVRHLTQLFLDRLEGVAAGVGSAQT
ncbi:hypothetical protein D3C84_273250 [compost metagenome]